MKKYIIFFSVMFAGIVAGAQGPTATRELRAARIKNGSATTAFPSTTNGTVATLARTESLYNKTLDSTSSAPAALISSGTFAQARLGTYLGGIAASQVTSGTLNTAQIGVYTGAIAASQVSSGTLAISQIGIIPKTSVSTVGTFAVADIPAFNSLHPMTTTGDMIYSSSGVTSSRLALGSSGQVLKVVGTVPTWATFSGGINYASSNADAESDTAGWYTYDNAAATPTDGSTGTFGGTWATTSSSPLRGTKSFLYTPGTTGEGVSFPAVVDRAEYGNMVEINFDYTFVTANGATGDYTVWVYDLTNTTMIQTAGYTIQGGVAGISQKHKATFQASTNGSVYKVLIHQAAATSAALKFDNVEIGPPKKSQGPAMTDWESFTPTGSWVANTTYTGKWRRVGDSMEGEVLVATSGAPTSANLTVNLPSGYSIDTSKVLISPNSAGDDVVGIGTILDAATANYAAWVKTESTTSLSIRTSYTAATYATDYTVTQAVPMTFGASDKVEFSFKVPISGWSSNVIMSNDTDTRVVAFYGTNTAATAQTGSFADVPWSTGKDSHGAFGGTSYTIPTSGYYQISAQVAANSVVAVSAQGIQIYKNGTTELAQAYEEGSTSSYATAQINHIAYLLAGDTIKIRSSNNQNYALLTARNYFSINRLSGPSAIAASETVAASYVDSAGSAIGTGLAAYTYATKIKDTHGGYSGGTYTIPVSGLYRMTATMTTASVTLSTTQSFTVRIYRNGSVIAAGVSVGSGGANNYSGISTTSYPCVAGDTIVVQVASSVATTALNTAAFNNFSIERIGNY